MITSNYFNSRAKNYAPTSFSTDAKIMIHENSSAPAVEARMYYEAISWKNQYDTRNITWW